MSVQDPEFGFRVESLGVWVEGNRAQLERDPPRLVDPHLAHPPRGLRKSQGFRALGPTSPLLPLSLVRVASFISQTEEAPPRPAGCEGVKPKFRALAES